MTSGYAVAEARRNLEDPAAGARLKDLLLRVEQVPESPARPLPSGLHIPSEDQPILFAAVQAGATHLPTGDIRHFGPYFGREISGVLILAPAAYFEARRG